jgi:hypothetical protein
LRDLRKSKNSTQRFARIRGGLAKPYLPYNQTSVEAHHHFVWVFDANTSTAQIYGKLRAQIELPGEGSHTSVLAYGKSGSGKTTTLFKGPSASGNLSILRQLIRDLLSKHGVSHCIIDVTWLKSHKNKSYSLLHDIDDKEREI